MNILIVGGAGYIGAHTVIKVLDAGHSVVVFDNFCSGEKLNIDPRAKIYEGDILSKYKLKEVFKRYNFDAVMHFAALKEPYQSMNNPEKYSEVNINGAINIINQMVKSNTFLFIFSSSCSVYGEPLNPLVDEDHPLSPLSFYGFTKLQIEKVLKWYSKLKKLNFVSLRYFNAVGYETSNSIKIPEINSHNLFPKIMNVITEREKFLKIYGSNHNTKDGTCIRDYIHVNDIAYAHLNALDYLQKKHTPLILNIATGKGYSVLEVVKRFEQLANLEIKYKIVQCRKGDPSKIISKTKFKESPINWKAKSSDLDTIITSILIKYKLYSKNNFHL